MSFCVVTGIAYLNDKKYKKYSEDIYIKYEEKLSPSVSKIIENEDEINIIIGDMFNISYEEFVNSGWDNDANKLLHIDGTFSTVKIDLKNSKIFFATCKNGIENMYYYYKDSVFMISDNFWDLVNIIKPKFEDIDQQSVFEMISYTYPLFYNTLIKELYIQKPATIGEFNILDSNMLIKEYWSFKYDIKENYNINEAIDRMDNILDNSMKKIKNKMGDVKFSLGLSGGLDSRIIPHYAKKNNLNISSFIIGVKKPNGIFISRDHNSAKKLADIYKISEHKEAEWSIEIEEKMKFDLKYSPLGSPQIFKLELDNLPKFDVLITGGSGFIVGSELPTNISKATTDEMFEYIKQHAIVIEEVSLFRNRVSRVLEYVFNIKYAPKPHLPKWYSKLVPIEKRDIMDNKIKGYIKDRISDGKKNIDIYEEYFAYYTGYRNRYGAFESICGSKRAFSIYMPFLFNETLTWPVDFLIDRTLLKKFVNEKIPEVSNVKLQSYGSAINKKFNKLQKVLDIIIFLLRGNGTAAEQKYFKKKQCKNKFIKDMMIETDWFYNIVNIKKEIVTISKEQAKLSIQLWKIKRLIDIIENGEYKDF